MKFHTFNNEIINRNCSEGSINNWKKYPKQVGIHSRQQYEIWKTQCGHPFADRLLDERQ